MGTKTQFTDYFGAELNHLLKQAELDVPQQYSKMMLMPLIGNYDDIDDYLNIQKALTRLMELNNEHIAKCIKLIYEADDSSQA